MQGALSDSIFPAMQENLSPRHMDLLGTWFASEKRNEYNSYMKQYSEKSMTHKFHELVGYQC